MDWVSRPNTTGSKDFF